MVKLFRTYVASLMLVLASLLLTSCSKNTNAEMEGTIWFSKYNEPHYGEFWGALLVFGKKEVTHYWLDKNYKIKGLSFTMEYKFNGNSGEAEGMGHQAEFVREDKILKVNNSIYYMTNYPIEHFFPSPEPDEKPAL